ncbi:MAG: CheR family methyltransferase [Pseudomonadota bacterium]
MTKRLPDTLLPRLSAFMSDNMALHFPPERWNDLVAKVAPAAREFGFSDVAAFVEWLISSPLPLGKMEILASKLTVSETYFWREPRIFQALEEQILPELVRERGRGSRHLRIWSAGCASGEEPYSLAMALHRILPNREDWQVTILATDINPSLLRRARAGVYSPWSFRNVPAWLKRDYFRPTADGKLEILPEIRRMVSFAYLNLAQDVYPSCLSSTTAMDIIFCRNVLMYFLPERARQVGQNLFNCLAEGGWLMVSACELCQQSFAQFTPVNFLEAIAYRRIGQQARGAAALWPADSSLPEVLSSAPCQPIVWSPSPLPPPSVCVHAENISPALAPLEQASVQTQSEADGETASEAMGQQAPEDDWLAIQRLADQGHLGEALQLCEKALALNKLDPGLHYLRATIFQEQNLVGEAIACLRQALYLEPNWAIAHFALGNLMLRQDNPRAAKKSFANVLDILEPCPRENILPEAGGLTVGRLREIVQASIQLGGLA